MASFAFASTAIERAKWIDKRDQLAAAQNELIERVLRGFGNCFRMDDEQHLDLVGDFVRRDLDLLDIEIAL